MLYLLYGGIIFFSVAQSAAAKFYHRAKGDGTLFNLLKAFSAFLFLALCNIGHFTFHAETFLYACLYGLSLSVSMIAGYLALANGPIALTGMIVSFSVMMPILYGILFCHEQITLYNIGGFLCLIAATVTVNIGKGQDAQERGKKSKWLCYVLLTFLANGSCSILQKMQEGRFPGQYSAAFMLYAMLVATAVFAVPTLPRALRGGGARSARGFGYAIFSGIGCAVANLLTTVMAGHEKAATLFPTLSAGTILLGLLCGRFLFAERMHLRHLLALIFGMISVVLLKL